MQRGHKIGLGLLMMMLLCVLFPNIGQAAPDPSLYLNGNSIKLPEKITMSNNSVMIPIRVVSEELGYKVNWNGKAQTVTINNDSKRLNLTVNQKTAKVNDKEVQLDVAPIVKQNATLVPLRFVGQNMGLTVEWDKDTKSVYLFTADESSPDVVPPTAGTPNGEDASTEGSNGNEQGEDARVTDFSFMNNQLHIATDSNVKPKIMTMTDPDRVVIDFPRTAFAGTFYERFSFNDDGQGEMIITDYPDVQRIRYAMFSDDPNTVRFVIDANYPLQADVATNGEGLATVSLVPGTGAGSGGEPVPPTKPDGKYAIVIDAGHGDHDSGAVSIAKRYEKDFNLALSLKVGELLRQDDRFHVVLTREDDTFVKLSDRAKIANDLAADLFVSIHANSIDNKPSITGTETYYWRSESKAFADTMHGHLVEGTQFKDRGVRKADHHVTRETKMPAILLEVGYLTNEYDESQLFDEQFQARVAENIVKGIQDYLGLL
ncbi:N-acetylmuramoyl-L-alanine amidase family protein [Paenibacillus apiarius]|uniref:N-acetylmuramoyl-L-alanine amidase family protein n=1 Tax=Paenibacillus apiarius TaxID=46240 RepID=A0ABT4DXF5_9BACL|nr:N-acetylmuramoyl-L-alanine amidase family protein [Paenibacillus apiarius]MBN3527551.1 N-acetylmuramoyl-L-alanine amidase [Paenibacillus apiarius]MCY9515843.1 N-acetylmuramoyl-L-alanine amidase family protein [Paenibacillus apiarius]MCY9520753.1 N-acetylmuramoyl-L-alanine amidase family protein [Paenibacillus apiarius]MCY9553457.1 N-acetylmuramoyl-L-alanine amidase family protein [Paenibacillus apiarius]MCY9558019.1 N-acetylmuramoyl-L-alanine amidase family protein [Paenibacillus apiarius]